ncbi:MAG TPA: winged helix-turn-helix domain-containing protein [Candidatus Thermoplasmatota archaeon]|nr:winged helix-turn-helix domain-containing protein [Candidatus Thermoplasmatota archaeon]
MTKITLDRETFKALASDTRLDILKTLDGHNMGLNEIASVTNLNKATLHEHLSKLNEAGLIKRTERDGHKWVYYKLTWKGESLLHPENTKIVVLFAMTCVALWVGIIELILYIKGTVVNFGYNIYSLGAQNVLAKEGTSLPLLEGSRGSNLYVPPDVPGFLREIFLRGRFPMYPSSGTHGIPLGGDIDVINGFGTPGTLTAGSSNRFVVDKSQGLIQAVYQNPLYLDIAIACFMVFTVMLGIALWRLWKNRTPKF